MPRPLFSLCLPVALAACGGGVRPAPGPAPVPTPAPRDSAPSALPAVAAASRFALRSGAAGFDVRSDASIEMTAGPQNERGKETVTTTARVDYEVTTPAGRPAAIVGQVDGFAVQTSSRVSGGAAPPPVAPVKFRGAIDARGARLQLDGTPLGCTSPIGVAQTAAVALARETIAWAPATIAPGAKWRDSSQVTTCRGPIGAIVTTLARYEISAVEGARVRVRRETTLTLKGGGIAGGRTVSISGNGVGVSTLEFDATRGRLMRAEGETRTAISVVLPDGERDFAQQVKTTVTGR